MNEHDLPRLAALLRQTADLLTTDGAKVWHRLADWEKANQPSGGGERGGGLGDRKSVV